MKFNLKIIFLFFLILLGFSDVFCQKYTRPEVNIDKFVQDLFGSQSADINYEQLYESLFQLYRNPLNINTASKEELQKLYILRISEIDSILVYRSRNGNFLSEYELQAVDGISQEVLNKLLPFIYVPYSENQKLSNDSFAKKIKNAEQHYFIARYEGFAEKEKGFTDKASPSQKYLGSSGQTYFRYRIQTTKDFSAGFTLEKDAGEPSPWIKQSNNRYGFDYMSIHASISNYKFFKSIVIGDYQVQIGQGLASASGFYIGKGAEAVTTTKRSGYGIKPYTGLLESGHMRGLASTIKVNQQVELITFYSNQLKDGSSYTLSDTNLKSDQLFLSSLITSGLHRTQTEIKNAGKIREQVFGANSRFTSRDKNLQIGITALGILFSDSVKRKDAKTYQLYDFKGDRNYNIGFDINYYWKNFNLFGEYSRSLGGGNGLVAGALTSLTKNVDVSVLIRNYDPNFYSFYGNSFGENSQNKNEKGIYWGLKFLPSKKFFVSAFYDYFTYPWLAYQIDRPSFGTEYMFRATYVPIKKVTIFAQYRNEDKERNYSDLLEGNNLTTVELVNRKIWMANIDYRVDKNIGLQLRTQFITRNQLEKKSAGMMMFFDINYQLSRKLKISSRYTLFNVDDYYSRIYVYEDDLLYNFSMPILYGKGSRSYVLILYKLNQKLDLWFKLGRFNYLHQTTVGSGSGEIQGNHKTDIKLQLRYKI